MQRIKDSKASTEEQQEEEVTKSYLLGTTAIGCADLTSNTGHSETKEDDDKKDEEEEEEEDEEPTEGLNAQQKAALGFVWFVSGIYAMLAKEILSKERDVSCSIR